MGIEPGKYQIKNHASWTVLDESTDDKHIIHGWQQTNQPNQHWDVIDSGSGAFHLQNVASKLFLHADGSSDGARLVGAPQPSPWYLDQQPNGEAYILFPGTNFAADLDNGNVADGTTIHLWNRTGAKQQQWFFEKV
ncbi:hypothetical protein RSOLAG22IIIB_12330 [Rhizoctonia solani]|nr:hypothetical protein RSOLAG22IIIB_12330 [Rhizoctonia solani]